MSGPEAVLGRFRPYMAVLGRNPASPAKNVRRQPRRRLTRKAVKQLGKVRKVILALALVLTVLLGGIGPMGSVADASHNPTSGCWFEEWTDHNDPSYGPHWGYYPDHGGWWYYQWFIHWENCEDGWGEFIEWHAHWYGPYGY